MNKIAKFKKWLWIAVAGWSLLICASFAFNGWQSWQSMLEQARSEGRTAFLKDLSYRVWNSSHGGVYVHVTFSTLHRRNVLYSHNLKFQKSQIRPFFGIFS
jgi:hypothetical protein